MTSAFDLILIAALLWLAAAAVSSPNLFRAVVLFIAFGLLTAIAWVRLHAPDIALAEAGIGAGITGALFLFALSRLERMDQAEGREEPGAARSPEQSTAQSAEPSTNPTKRSGAAAHLVPTALALVPVLLISAFILNLPAHASGLRDEAFAHLTISGAQNPVTSVLLNYRAYDTLLELGVLLLALVAVRSLPVRHGEPGSPNTESAPSATPLTPDVQTALTHLLVPVLIVTAGYLLYRGTSAPGGAFQAGALLGGAGVLLLLAYPTSAMRPGDRTLRLLATTGLFVFTAIGLAMMLREEGHFLAYPIRHAPTLILIIESAAAISIGVTLALLIPREAHGRNQLKADRA